MKSNSKFYQKGAKMGKTICMTCDYKAAARCAFSIALFYTFLFGTLAIVDAVNTVKPSIGSFVPLVLTVGMYVLAVFFFWRHRQQTAQLAAKRLLE